MFEELFKEPDRENMIANSKKILGNVSRLKLMASEEFQPKLTASWSLSISSPSNQYINPIDEHLSRTELANIELLKIVKAINKLDKLSQRILIDKYINHNNYDYNIYRDYNLSESDFYRKLSQALFQFAYTYDKGQLVCYLGES